MAARRQTHFAYSLASLVSVKQQTFLPLELTRAPLYLDVYTLNYRKMAYLVDLVWNHVYQYEAYGPKYVAVLEYIHFHVLPLVTEI